MLQKGYLWLRGLFDRIFENALFRRLVKNSSYLFSSTGIAAALGMIQGILVARLLGVSNYGILAAIISFTSMVNKFASFRMSELVIKYVGHYSETGEMRLAAAIFKVAALVEMITSLVAFGLVYLLAPLGAQYLAKDPSLANLFIIYGVIILANLIAESSTGLLQIFDRFRRIAALNLASSIVSLALVVLAYLAHGGLLAVLLAYIGGKAVGALGLSLAAIIEASRRWSNEWWRTPISLLRPQRRALVHFAVSTNISATLSLVTKDSEVLWVSLFRNPVEAGYYKLALTLANIVQLPVSPLPQATYPELSRQVARQRWDNMRYILRQGSLLAGGYTLAASLFLLFLGKPLIAFLYSAQYLPSYPALLILLTGYLVANTFYWRRPALLALGRADFPAKVNLVLALLKFLGILMFVPVYGYMASAALLSLFYWVGSGITVWKVRSVLTKLAKQEIAA